MRRLLAAARCDVRLQLRNGFHYAAAFVVAAWGFLLYRARALDWGDVLPALLLGNLVVSTFYFLAGLVLLEKGERTLEALVVTPLRSGEYLAAKVGTLTLLATAESLLIAVLLRGAGFGVPALVAGCALAAVLFCLAGFLAVVRYDSINQFLLPSVAYTSVLLLPLFPYLGVGDGPWVYLHPVQAPLLVIRAAFRPVGAGELVYGVAYSAVWIALLWAASRRAFHHFVVAGTGRR